MCILLGCVATCCFVISSRAADIDLGIGPAYQQLGLVSSVGRGESYYDGGGARVELRLRTVGHILKIHNRRNFGFDFFVNSSLAYSRNVKRELGEKYRLFATAAGVDFFYGVFFGGAQYELDSAIVRQGGSRADLFYSQYGPRAGLHFRLRKHASLRIGSMFQFGTVDNIQSNPRSITEFRVFVLYSFNFVRTDPWWIAFFF